MDTLENVKTPKDECEDLLNEIMPAVNNLLIKNKEFYPVGAVMGKDGEISFTAYASENEHPTSEEVLQELIKMHKQKAEEDVIKASAIAWNAVGIGNTGKKSDMVAISLEHKDNYSVVIVEPYKIGLFKKVTFEQILANEGKTDIWANK